MRYSFTKSIMSVGAMLSLMTISQAWAESFSVTYTNFSGDNCPADVVDIVKTQGLIFKFSTFDYRQMSLLGAQTEDVATPSVTLSNEGISDMYAYILPNSSTLTVGGKQYELEQLYILSDKTNPPNWHSGFYLNADKSCLVETDLENKI